jgi:hypothetical protein
MQLLTVADYARLKNISTQAVYKQIKNRRVKTKTKKIDRVHIVVEDTTPPAVQ